MVCSRLLLRPSLMAFVCRLSWSPYYILVRSTAVQQLNRSVGSAWIMRYLDSWKRYNCLFATAYSKAVCDLSLMLDNQAAYKLCRDQLAVKNPVVVPGGSPLQGMLVRPSTISIDLFPKLYRPVLPPYVSSL